MVHRPSADIVRTHPVAIASASTSPVKAEPPAPAPAPSPAPAASSAASPLLHLQPHAWPRTVATICALHRKKAANLAHGQPRDGRAAPEQARERSAAPNIRRGQVGSGQDQHNHGR
jgi:hypothetical protein